ncbi:MAG: bifunctional 4-hydroxy-2-oxoglutarate aldolase/2-dehydro-3-deoxy-phosphogluconate aldolase [Clostridiales bacterium]|jgi:2-dehydro-3-deoxyphosphogluconate aldolase/(4S)-4-hydroxy-2-oxoglutarate aldolase|nr:bifunctional 4-hydroxy-2-oxoglutarate aldolase/2-dehydro-3-deoxy-phosphogluconate aldolase [Clostridiales bacterium]
MNDILEQIQKIGIIPVIAISDASKAIPLANALLEGGVPCAEITFRTAFGEESIRKISEQMPEILVCAGTVLTCEQAQRAKDAGAKFVVSPGLNPKVVRYCVGNNILIVPGCATPSDMEAAMEFGLSAVKFFPAEQAGGLNYIKAVSAPYPNLSFIPTGGINASNIGKYAAFGKVLACGGSWMVTKELIDAGNFTEITRLCREAVQIVKDARMAAREERPRFA